MMTLGSLFDGIGVFPLSGIRHGIKPVWASEIEKSPISITKKHFPNMEHLGDISSLNGGEVSPVDVVTFGSPCQNLSQIGDRIGLAGEKSGLFYDAIRIINQMREVTNGKYPTFAVWENVPGAFSSGMGADFRAVIETFTNCEIPMPDKNKWAAAGMVPDTNPQIAWRCLDSKYFRSAQSRRRVFLVADYRGRRAGEILFNPEPINEILEVGAESGLPIPAGDRNDASQSRRDYAEIRCFRDRKMRGGAQYNNPKMFLSAISKPDTPCPTLLARDTQRFSIHYPDNPENDIIRKLTPKECEILMGLPVGWTEYGYDGKAISDSARYKALGNSIVVGCAEYVMYGISKALREEVLN